MGLWGWFRRDRGAAAARQWHAEWEAAAANPTDEALRRLEAGLALVAPRAHAKAEVGPDAEGDPDTEVEDEMLQALRDVLALEHDLRAARLPSIETAHRVAAGEPCHYSAPVSMPDDPAQPTGRLLLTSGRAAFAGGSRTPSFPWHATRHVVRSGRDLILVRAGSDEGCRFRCNSFSDALCAAAIARHLIRATRKPL